MSDNDMIHKEDIYAAFGKTMPEEVQTDDSSVDPFVDVEDIDTNDTASETQAIDAEPLLESIDETPASQPYIYEDKDTDMPVQDYRHYGFLRTTIILAIIVLGFTLSAEQQNIIHLTVQGIVLYPWYPLIIIALSLGLLWYKSWIGKAVGGLIILLVVATTSYFELYDSLSINSPVQTSRSQSLRLAESNTTHLYIDDVVSTMTVSKWNNNIIDATQSGERSLDLYTQSWNIFLSGANTWNITTLPESSIALWLPGNKSLAISSKQLRADNIWNLSDLRTTSLRTIGGSLDQEIIAPTIGSLQYLTVQARWSDVDLTVPSDIGLEIQLDNWIDIKELADLEQIDTDLYRSKNFAQTDRHLRVRVDSVFSSFTLHRD